MKIDPAMRRSLDEYVRRRIMEIPDEVKQFFPGAGRIWKCQSESDFLYGYYVGRIEEGSLRYLLKATRASGGGYLDMFEIRDVIESHRDEIRAAVGSDNGRAPS